MSSFFGLNVALTALRANQYAMDVTGHNIANANTEGYRRQEAVFTANHPYTSHLLGSATTIAQLGTGVDVREIRRTQTDFLDAQIRMEMQQAGMWGTRNEAMQQIEPLFIEPSSAGLSATLDKFWNAWQNLSASPESVPARTAVVSSGTALADQIRNTYENMHTLQKELDQQIGEKAEEINSLLEQIANINNMTVATGNGQLAPNDLIDKRDLLVERLSKILRIEVHGTAGANLMISAGGRVLVQGNYRAQVSVGHDSNDWSKLVWNDDGSDIAVSGGEVKGLMDMRDSVLGGYLTSLDNIARAVVNRVNALHDAGYDANGGNCGMFFVPGTGAADIRVDNVVASNPSRVAASSVSGVAGDNTIAVRLANVKKEVLIGTQTVGEAYSALVAQVGTHAKEASVHSEAHEYALNQRKTQRESVAGVSLDEEMSNMVKFQQAYNAAARIFTVLDEMLDAIINVI